MGLLSFLKEEHSLGDMSGRVCNCPLAIVGAVVTADRGAWASVTGDSDYSGQNGRRGGDSGNSGVMKTWKTAIS
jgi:hypothetical protein